MQCPNCGSDNQTGNYCASCGAALDVTCPSCGADVPAGAAYCTACGTAVGSAADGGGGGGGALAPGIIAVAALVIVVVLVVLYLPGETRTAAPSGGADAPVMAPGGMGSGGGAPGMGGLSSDMRTNADRLFNRIMMAAEEGNQAEIDQFMPMAIQAYGMVDDLDHDGLFHLGMLHLTAGSYDQAVVTAQRILNDDPDHLLGIAVAAQAEGAAGDSAEARSYWERFLDAYPTESGKPLPAYVDHQPVLPTYRDMAREATGRP